MNRRIIIWSIALCLSYMEGGAQETLMELSEPADMVAWIFYEEQEPEVVVTGPDGTEYSEKLGTVQVKRGESSVYLYIPDAQPGRWTIRYDNQNSGNVRFVCSPSTESISISSFTIEQAQNNQVRAVFQADFPSQRFAEKSI